MKTSFGAVVISLLVLWAACAEAQNNPGDTDTTATQVGPQPAFIYPDATPSLNFLSESLENSSITLGVNTGFTYYNYTSSSGGVGLFMVAPYIKLQQFRRRIMWNLGYSGGYQTYVLSPGPAYNSNLFSQSATAGLRWQIAPHWQLAANNAFRYTANPFESYVTITGTPTINNPNPVTYIPLTQYKLNQAIVTLTNQLTQADALSFSGTSMLRETSTYNLVSSVPFYNLISYGGIADYQHKLSPKLRLGASYAFNSLDFGHGLQRSGVNTILLTGEYSIRPNMTISGWLGPQYTTTKSLVDLAIPGQIVSVPSYGSLWSTALGANYQWRGQRNVFTAGLSRQVMDGSGITATSEVTNVHASYRRMFTSKLDGLLGAGYFHDVSIIAGSRNYNSASFNALVDYNLARSLVLRGEYAFVHFDASSAFLINRGSYSDNRVGISLSYSWNHPLGR